MLPSSSSEILQLVLSYVSALPVYLLWIAAGIIAIVRWRIHPRVSLLTVIACGVLLVGSIANHYVMTVMPRRMAEGGATQAAIGNVLGLLNVGFALIQLAGWILVFIALFGWRKPQGPASISEEVTR